MRPVIGFVPAEAKLRPPSLMPGLIPRGELVDLLRETVDRQVVLITAPAGYGKTTLASQWAAEDARPFVWITLDETSNDPAILGTYLLLGLQELFDVTEDGALDALADGADPTTVLLPRIGRTLQRQQTSFVIVFDNADEVSSPASIDALLTVIRHLSSGCQAVIVARTPPKLPWSRLRAERRLVVVDSDDLRFTASDAHEVARTAGVELGEDDVVALMDRTEGWPAGVFLAAMSLQRTGSHRAVMTAFAAPGTPVAEHLRRELIQRLSPEQRRFVVQTSVLDRLCGPLCDTVLATTGSARMLRELARGNQFVVPIAGDDLWYRYHPVYADILRSELSTLDPRQVLRLHSRASAWLESAGDVDEAIRHAQAAQEIVRAARLIWIRTPYCLGQGRVDTLRRWLDEFTSEQMTEHAELALAAAWVALETGASADYWITVAERASADSTHEVEGGAATAMALLHAHRALGGVERMLADTRQATRLLPPADPWSPYAGYLHAVATLLLGAADEAREDLELNERLAAELGSPVHQSSCLAQIAVIAVQSGDWAEAARQSDLAWRLLDECAAADLASTTLLRCVRPLLLARNGEVDRARHLAQRAVRQVATAGQTPPWLDVETRYVLARVHLLLGDTAAARVRLSEAQALRRSVVGDVWLGERLRDTWEVAQASPLALGVGPSALTSAEMRLLQLLPTHLSFERIGQRLGVSRNTVKTQAIAAYRKLDVSSRAEAVQRARAMGLIHGEGIWPR